MNHTFTISEEQRQGILLALGHLAVERPGWHPAYLQKIAEILEGPTTPQYGMHRRTWDRERREACLIQSHKLLYHNSNFLDWGIFDHIRGLSEVPATLEAWIDACESSIEEPPVGFP